MYRQGAGAGVGTGAGTAAGGARNQQRRRRPAPAAGKGGGGWRGTRSAGCPAPARDGVEMTVCGSPAPSPSSPTLPEAQPPGRGAKWRWIGSTQVRVMAKLDESQVKWIVGQRRKGTPVAEVAEGAHVSCSWVKKLARRYKGIPVSKIVYPYTMGRPRDGLPGRREHSIVISAYYAHMEGATLLVDSIEESTGLRFPHHVVHAVLKENGLARTERGKSGQRKTARYVKRYSNTMWHTDYKLLSDNRWLVSFQDDASRRIMGWGIFERATAANAIGVLDVAIAKHGAPLSILSDHGSTFCDNESGGRRKGEGQFERYLKERRIRHIKARVGHPQTNGKLERVHGEMERKLHLFMEASAARTTRSGSGGGGGGGGGGATAHVGGPFYTAAATDPVARFFVWFNNERPNMALDTSIRETPAQAYRRKMPKPGDDVQRDLETSGAYA